jgi:hypothetical protein
VLPFTVSLVKTRGSAITAMAHTGCHNFLIPLEDETGSLAVVVLGSCSPSAVDALPKDGDRVQVTGYVQVLQSEAPRDVRVQATAIQILESH